MIDVWASDGLIVEPTLDKKENGWDLGEQPPHEYMNWLQNTFGEKLNHILQNGVPLWNAETDYLEGNIVQVDGIIYRAKTANNNSEPPNNNWLPIGPYAAKNSIEADEGAYQLVGDDDNPGANKIYGTNGSGEKGWQNAPSQADGFVTGDLKWRYDNAALAGYVRLNGRSIGKAGSAATERANADTELLYIHLWTVDPNLNVSGGRGASAAADFAAGKVLSLPDAKNRAPFAVDGMGGTNTNRITGGTALGVSGGAEEHILVADEIPEHTHGIPIPQGFRYNSGSGAHGYVAAADIPKDYVQTTGFGSGQAHNNMPPFIILGTVYMKL